MPAPSDDAGRVLVRQSDDWDKVFVKRPSAADWSLAFARPDAASDPTSTRATMGPSSALDQLKSASTIDLLSRLEPSNASILAPLCPSLQTVRVHNDSRGPRTSLSAPTLVVRWDTAFSYALPDLSLGKTQHLIVQVTDAGGPISPANRRWMPDLPDAALQGLRDVVLDFSRWSHCAVDPFTAVTLYRTLARLLLLGIPVTVVAYGRVHACMGDTSVPRPLDRTRWTGLPERAENAVKGFVMDEISKSEKGTGIGESGVEGKVREVIGRLSVMSREEYEGSARAKL